MEHPIYAVLDEFPPLAVGDEDLKVVYANVAAAHLYGWPDRFSGLGMPAVRLVIAEDRPRVADIQDRSRPAIGKVEVLRGLSLQHATGGRTAISSASGWLRLQGRVLRLAAFVVADTNPTDDLLIGNFLQASLALATIDLPLV